MSLHTSKRTGLIAKKIGMTQVFDATGSVVAVTLLQADNNIVVDIKTEEKNGYNAVVLGFGQQKAQRVNKPQRAAFEKLGVMPRKLKEFRVSADCLLNVGDKLSINHFMPQQKIDIHGVSIGKGFAGGMKRHNFRGLEASHGVSVSHRSHGSTGNRQDPGRTFPGKKMAGHLGVDTTTVQSVAVVMIDEELGVIAVAGSVPGKNGSYVYIADAVKVTAPSQLTYPAALCTSDEPAAASPQDDNANA